MQLSSKILALMLVVCPLPAASEAVELSQAELRQLTTQLDVIPTRRLVEGVEDFSGGRVVEIRAFAINASVAYRVLIRQSSGQISSLLVDGQTGHAIHPTTRNGREISAAASVSSVDNLQQVANDVDIAESAVDDGRSNSNAGGNSNNGNNGNSGNSNAGGNSGNRGNSDRGNSGNNGNGGNSGNNGNGNGGNPNK